MMERSICELKSLDYSDIPKNYNISDDISIFSYDKKLDRNCFFFEEKEILIDGSLFKKGFDEKTSKETEDKENLGIKNKQNLNNKKEKKEGKKPKEKKKRGRNPETSGKHNKFSDDNIRRKCKHIIINELKEFINNKIKQIYNGDIGQGLFMKKLLDMNQKQKVDSTASFNKEFLNKSLKDIFSENISSRYKILPLNFNKRVIKNLINEEDEAKRIYFQNLFNLTFIQSLNHFIGTIAINELKGLNSIDDIKEKYNLNNDYFETLKFYFFNYEDITKNKRIKINYK